MDLEEIGINAGNWVDTTQDRDYWRALVNAALNLRVSKAMELVNNYYELKILFWTRACPNRLLVLCHLVYLFILSNSYINEL